MAIRSAGAAHGHIVRPHTAAGPLDDRGDPSLRQVSLPRSPVSWDAGRGLSAAAMLTDDRLSVPWSPSL